MTLSEQKLINRVVNETNNNTIFVIHNLKNLYSKEQIENYIENTFKKNIFLNFKKFSKQNYKNKKTIEFNSILSNHIWPMKNWKKQLYI